MKDRNPQGPNARTQALPNVETLTIKAKEMLSEAIKQVQATAGSGQQGRIFPNGIDLIYIRFEVGTSVAWKAAVELKLAGPAKPDGLTA